jgi:hypothetical protein
MTEAAAAAPPAAAAPLGQHRGPWFVALIGLITFGIYWITGTTRPARSPARLGRGLGAACLP